jgi:dUTP pyrophosphatase
MNIKKLNENAKIPTRGSKDAAGYDLYTTESYELKVGERKGFKTDISMAIPIGVYGRIAPRSGLAVKKGIDVLAGVIDSDYRGEIIVALINLGQEPVQINVGDKIAQMIFEKYYTYDFREVDDLNVTDRNLKGFGSTDAVAHSTQSKSPITIPDAVSSALTEMYGKKHAGEIPAKPKYSEIMKEREKNL